MNRFYSFPAHSAYLAAVTFAAFLNGAGYYLDVFGRKTTKNSEDSS